MLAHSVYFKDYPAEQSVCRWYAVTSLGTPNVVVARAVPTRSLPMQLRAPRSVHVS